VLWILALSLSALAGDLQVHILDVGQGDAILLEAANGKRVLIDAGPSSADVAQQLEARGIQRIDMVVGTHPHADHIGGMAAVLKTKHPKMYVDNGQTHTTLTYKRTMVAVKASEAEYRAGINGRTFHLDTDVKLTVLHPRSNLLRGTRSDLNSNSIVIRIDHQDDCILLTGDAEDPTERSLLGHQIEPCEVLKVAHHGSAHSTSSAWLRAVQPRIALISVGSKNRYNHPARETLDRLKSAGVEVHRTDLEGTITLLSTGKGITVSTERVASDTFLSHKDLSDASAGRKGGLVNINLADAVSLDQLPGIGPARAAAIIADRTSRGPFSTCDELMRVKGIGPKTVAGLQPTCTTSEPAP